MPPQEKLLDVIKASVYSPAFYKAVLSKPLSWSFKYFFSFILIIAVISTAVFGWRLVPTVNSFLSNLAPTILKYFPNELEVVIKDGQATSNVAEPFLIPFPHELAPKSVAINGQNPDEFVNLLVINTKAGFTDWKEFQGYETMALLSKDAIVFMDKGGIKIQPLTGIPNTTINKKELTAILEGIKPFMKFAAPLLVLFIFLGVYSVLSFKVVYLLVAALVLWLIAAKFKGLKIGYKKSYQVGLHAVTAALLLETVLQLFFGVRIPYVFTILTLVIAWFNLSFEKEESPTPPVDKVPA